MSTTTVPSPVRYTQYDDSPIRDSYGRALIEGTSTHVLVAKLMDEARSMARVTGSVSCKQVETVLGVVVEAEWKREPSDEDDDEPERDLTFSLDAVVARLHKVGIPAHVDQTGGGCATIYAGGRHVVLDGTEERVEYDVAAGPGAYGYDRPSTATLEEFAVGPNDEGLSEAVSLPDTILTSAAAVAWAADQILKAVIETEGRSFAQWNRRVCTRCTTVLVPGPHGSWVALDLAACPQSEDGTHSTVWH